MMAGQQSAEYPKGTGKVRPFRLWDAKAKKPLAHRCYAIKENAHMGALSEARWAKVGTVYDVYDVRNGKMIGQYIRRVNTIDFWE